MSEIKNEVHLVVLRGANGMVGGHNIHRTMKQFDKEQIHYVANPSSMDFGQKNCIQHLQELMKKLDENKQVEKIVIHASSQGTATVLNYLGNNPSHHSKISMIIMESVLASGNLSIASVTNCIHLPVLNWYIPYIAKCMFWSYSPTGMQGISSIQSWPRQFHNIPIVILNAEIDYETPLIGAQATYNEFLKRGFNNMYFFKLKGHRHTGLLESNLLESLSSEAQYSKGISKPTLELSTVHSIMRDNGLPYVKEFIIADSQSNLNPIKGADPLKIINKDKFISKILFPTLLVVTLLILLGYKNYVVNSIAILIISPIFTTTLLSLKIFGSYLIDQFRAG